MLHHMAARRGPRCDGAPGSDGAGHHRSGRLPAAAEGRWRRLSLRQCRHGFRLDHRGLCREEALIMPRASGNTSNKKTKTPLGAGVAGASGGTSILALVSSIPDTSHWKPVLLFATPTIAVAISAIWVFAMSVLQNWIDDIYLDYQLKKAG